ncbi:MAG: hypothetical protein ACYDCI_11790 [Candidatus Limnocylindrales bacterium]
MRRPRLMRPLNRFARLAALSAARDLAMAAARSATARDLLRHGVRDPRGLARRLADPRSTVGFVRRASRDPSVREIVRVGLFFMPLRYWAIGRAAIWTARRVTGRHGGAMGRALPVPSASS